MKFTVESKSFGAAIAIAGRVVPTKTPWPIITNIYLRAVDGRLTIRGTNADTSYEADLSADVTEPGETAISHATLAKFFSAAKGDSLSMDVADGKATIRCGRGRIVLSAVSTEEFPSYPPAKGEPVSIDRDTLLKAIQFCSAAVTPSETKFHIAGVNISESDGWLDVWGTDGKIAHHARIVGVSSIGGGGQLPIEAVGIISGVAEKAETVKIMVSDVGWHLDAGSVRAWGKVIDAKYPDMDRALAAFGSWGNVANVDSSDMSKAIEVAVCGSDANSDKTRHIVLRCTDKMTLRGYKPGIGTIVAGMIEVDADIASETAIALNADYLRASLGGIAGGVTIRRSGEAIRVEPSQMSGTMPMAATIFGIRASEEDLADV